MKRVSPFLASFVLASMALAATWRELGPAPITSGEYTGRVSAIVCSPTLPTRYFVAGADGGVWRTSDGGTSWTPLTDHMPTTAIGALALDPTDENVIYAGTGEANFANHSRYGLGLYKSTDGGDTWSHLAAADFSGRCFSRIVVNPQQPQTLYASLTHAGGFPALAAAKGHPQADGPVGVFRSDDGGATWAPLTNGLPAVDATDLALDPANPSILYACIGHIFGNAGNGVYKSIDAGASWTRLNIPASPVGRISIAVAPSNPLRLYALLTRVSDPAGGGASVLSAWRSDNGGETWTVMTSVSGLQATYGWYLSVVTVQPTNPDVVILGGLNLVRSSNAGGSWATITPPHVDLHAAAWDASGRLLVGDDGGVHRSSSLGANWNAINNGLGLIQFYAGLSTHPAEDDIVYGGTQDNGTNRRDPGELGWTQVFGGDGGWTQVDRTAPLRVFAEFQGSGNLFRSTDGGDSFIGSGTGINTADRNSFLPAYLIDPANPSRMLYATHRIYRSVNGGANWTPLSGDLTAGAGAIRALAIAPSDPMVVYAATNDGRVLVSSNGGANFDIVLSGVPGWPRTKREITVSPDAPGTAYLATGFFGTTQLRRTTDFGQSWTALDGALPDIPVNVVEVDVRFAQPILYAGTDSGLLRSINGGEGWGRFGEGLPNAPVIDLKLDTVRDRLIAATQGRGAWSIAGLTPGDLNGDGTVDLSDLATLLAAFGCQTSPCAGDADGDGGTDLSDLAILLAYFGS